MEIDDKNPADLREETVAEERPKKINKVHLIVITVATILIILLSLLAYRLLSDINSENEIPTASYSSFELPPENTPNH